MTLRNQVDEAAQKAANDTVVRFVKDFCASHPSASLSEISRAAGMSTRTIHRALARAGTGYRAIRDARLRKIFASHSHLSGKELCALTGFTNPPAFFRAYKRITGHRKGE